MSDPKTQPTNENPADFIARLQNERRRSDSFTLLEIFERVTGLQAVMWGAAIVGFGSYHYKSNRSTQEGDWPLVAFSPRKQNLTLYVDPQNFPELLKDLGKHTASVSCLYINKLADVDTGVLEQLIAASFERAEKTA